MSVRRFVMVAALCVAPLVAWADDIPYWPSDQAKRLEEVEHAVVEKMDEISAARVRNDSGAVERLTKEFKSLQDERVQLLRATGKLQ